MGTNLTESLVLLNASESAKEKTEIRSKFSTALAKRLVEAAKAGDWDEIVNYANLVYMYGYSTGYDDGVENLNCAAKMTLLVNDSKEGADDTGGIQGAGPVQDGSPRGNVQPADQVP